MVYPKSWKSEDKFGTGKTLKSVDWVWIHTSGYEDLYLQHCMPWRSSWLELREFTFVSERKSFELNTCDIEYELNKMSFWMMFHHLSFVLEERRMHLWLPFDHGCDLDSEIFFFNPLSTLDWHRIEHPYNVVNVVRWDAMSKGGMKVDHPMGKGD